MTSRQRAGLGLALASLASTPARAETDDHPPTTRSGAEHRLEAETKRLSWWERQELLGYVQSDFRTIVRPSAVPRDALEVRFVARAGVSAHGRIAAGLHYTAHAAVAYDEGPVLELEQATLGYDFLPWLSLDGGHRRIPFTIANTVANFQLQFPDRPRENEAFVSGADTGLLLSVTPWQERVRLRIGAYEGGSLGLIEAEAQSRGLTYVGRADLAPLGRLASSNVDYERGPFRFGLGGAGLYRLAEVFDETGFLTTTIHDLRWTASLEMSFRGLFLLGEYVARSRRDSFSGGEDRSSGLYAQLTWFLALNPQWALQPQGRVGMTDVNQSNESARNRVLRYEGGINLYAFGYEAGSDAPRLGVEYTGERRITDVEEAHGGRLFFAVTF